MSTIVCKTVPLKKISLLVATIVFINICCTAQDSVFSVFRFQPPPFFTRIALSSALQFDMKNNDSSFCSIILYKTQKAGENVMKDIALQWKEKVVRKLSKANNKPEKILTEQLWDGWVSTLAIGNFYYKKKKCIVMLYSFRKEETTVCTVFAFSDKIFKGPIEQFSKNLHLTKQ